ncbi:Rz1-like lysis system protein LysC [Duganella sp. SG902]|uniref:Rz1-like lysis system protein LysC n=1 Tax=Duganella sp. SG902 TaxID=2587016 RepID=UPI001E3F14BA|nr:Rz1-like lysis system protein LysC [Duganella sp. SG902]
MLSGCGTTAPLPAPRLIASSCPRVQPCSLPAVRVRNNGDMNAALDQAEGAWALCAAVVDTIVECQAKDQAEGLGHD